MSTAAPQVQTPEDYDDGIYVPPKSYPLVVHFGGKKEAFDQLVAEGKAETDPAEKKKLAEKAKHAFPVTGYWFIEQEKYEQASGTPEQITAAGWKPYSIMRDDKPILGYATNDLKMLVCRQRAVRELKRAEKDRTDMPMRHPWFAKMTDAQRGKYQERLQMIGIIAGLEELGPVVVTHKTSAARSILGNSQQKDPGILNLIGSREGQDAVFYRYVLAAAAKEMPGVKVAQNWYWLHLTHARTEPKRENEVGFPFYNKIQYGEGKDDFVYVTPVVWAGLKEAQEERNWDGWKKLRALDELIREGDQIRRDTHDWASEWSAKGLQSYNARARDNEAVAANEAVGYAGPSNGRQSVPPLPDEGPRWDELGNGSVTEEEEAF